MTFEAAFLPDAAKEQLCRSLLGEFGVRTVKVRGAEMIHGCVLPFKEHRDQKANPTASLNYEKLTYNCLGCGHSGGLLWFIATMRGESTHKAREWLDDETGFGPDAQDLPSLLAFFDALYAERDRPPPLPKMDPRVLDPWKFIHPYMTEIRGVPEETLIAFSVGYGTIPLGPVGEQVMSERIIIPHFWDGNLVGWQSRRLRDDGTPKYQSSPDFPKDTTVYGYDPQASGAIVVESPLSVLSKHHVGPRLEATFGAKVTEAQIRRLSVHKKVILWMDNDDAGWEATRTLGDGLEPYSDVWVVPSPWAADPGDLDADEYVRLLGEITPYALWTPPEEVVRWEPATAAAATTSP